MTGALVSDGANAIERFALREREGNRREFVRRILCFVGIIVRHHCESPSRMDGEWTTMRRDNMASRKERDAETGREMAPASGKPAFVEPEVVKRGTLPEITWYGFSGHQD